MFTQLCVWHGTTLGDKKPNDLIKFLEEEFGCRFKYAEEVTTLSGDGGEGGRTDQFFFVHDEDIPKFAVPRLQYGIRWWEDVLTNLTDRDAECIYPLHIREKYQPMW